MFHRQQKEILQKAKETYPQFRLKHWSEKTGIQLTRIFRLFHGKEMTLNEYMAFYSFLSKEEKSLPTDTCDEFFYLANKGLEHLPKAVLEELTLNIKYHLENYFILQGKTKTTY